MLILVFDTSEDRDKFVILYETYGKTIYYTLSRYNLDEHTKEDLSQDIYIILAVHLDNIDITNHKKTQNYIITITRNYCKNYLRNTNRHPEDFLDEIPEPQTDEDGILDYLITKDRNNRLIEEVNKLDDIYKSVLELKYINEFSNDEIASFMKIKKKTVEMRLYRANLILRERLKVQGDV